MELSETLSYSSWLAIDKSVKIFYAHMQRARI